jgi:RNA polymerase sigma-70 factor (ECF subfamily)
MPAQPLILTYPADPLAVLGRVAGLPWKAATASAPGRMEETVAAMPSDPDYEEVARARRGDEVAFRLLVDRHRDRAYAVARRVLRSAEDAEEVAQDSFVRAWQALPEFRGESRFATWLHRIVVRRALDRAESLKRRRDREQSIEVAAEPATPGLDLDAARRARRLEQLSEGLSPIQRAAVALFYYEDQSVERVADVLGIPENTVKTHLSRARTALRTAWEREESSS